MAIYNNRSKTLQELLSYATNPSGATLLIPELQRPYRWQPSQVVRLVDSLIKGWPVGTLLLWNVNRTLTGEDAAGIPCRSFWTTVDRVDGSKARPMNQMLPPAEYLMVLDGQQRIQSLMIAFHGDESGFVLSDRDWSNDSEDGGRSRSSSHSSTGTLCIDIESLARAY